MATPEPLRRSSVPAAPSAACCITRGHCRVLPRALVTVAMVALALRHLPAQSPPASASPDVNLAEAKRRLAACGYGVADAVACETRTSAEVLADLDAQQDLLLPEHAFELQNALFRGLGLRAARDGRALRRRAVAELARGMSAYYDPLRKVFVQLPTATREASEQLAGPLPLLIHELAHAHQDAREGGLRALFARDPRTLDASLARRCIVEGEAELATVLAVLGEAEIATLEHNRAAAALDGLFAGEMTSLIYATGRTLMAVQYRTGGLDAVRALWGAPPVSTEQALHPAKLGRDLPSAVHAPTLEGVTAARATVLGELLTFSLLRQLGLQQLDAAIAAAGWDGDLLAAYDRDPTERDPTERDPTERDTADREPADRDVALLWRSVWDRDSDAADFAARLAAKPGDAIIEHQGRVVDWIHAADPGLRARLRTACVADRTAPEASAGDVESTVAAELALRERLDQGERVGDLWRQPALGLAIPIPTGWKLRDVRGTMVLIDEASAKTGFAVNANVTVAPRRDVADIEALRISVQSELERLKLDAEPPQVAKQGEVEVVRAEFGGRVGRGPAVRCLSLTYLRGKQIVTVTITTTDDLWPKQSELLRKLRDGVVITPE